MKRLLFFLVLLPFLFSCSKKEVLPDYLWEEDKFIAAMTEIQIAESIVRLGYHRTADSLYRNDSIYASALKKLNVSKIDFDSNMSYYLRNPEKFDKIYEEVLNELSRRTAELKSNFDIREDSTDLSN